MKSNKYMKKKTKTVKSGTGLMQSFMLCILSPVITGVVLTLVFFLKKVYPFGYSNVIHTDMIHSYVPLYYHLWDCMHGGKNLFYDIYSAGGINMAGSVSFISLLSPLNVVFFFIDRDIIPEFMSIFTAFKIILTALSSGIFFNYVFRKNGIINVCLSLLYTFSGFVLIYQSNIMWLDMVFLFPFFALSLMRLVAGRGNLAYIFMVFLCMTVNFYLMCMTLLFVILLAGTYILFYGGKIENRRALTLRLGLCTLAGMLLSMFSVLPGLIHMTGGVRAESGRNIIEILYKLNFYSHQKWGMLLTGSFLVVIMIFMHITRKKYMKEVIFSFIIVFFLAAQLVFENINAIWHFGEYYCFPMRYSYMLIFVMACAVGYFAQKYRGFPETKQPPAKFKAMVLCGAFLSFGVYILVYIFNGTSLKFNIIGDTDLEILNNFMIMYISMLIYYYLVVYVRGVWGGRFLIFIGVLAEIFMYSMVFIGLPTALKFDMNVSDVLLPVNNVRAVAENYGNNEIYEKSKWVFSPNVNYGFIIKSPSLSNWTHMISRDKKEAHIDLGYSSHNTVLYENGGTAFSDALLGVKNVFSIRNTLDYGLYKEIDKVKDVYVYEALYELPFGVIMNGSAADYRNSLPESDELYNPIAAQNQIYRRITGLDEDIISYSQPHISFVNLEKTENIKGNSYKKTDKETDSWIDVYVRITGKKALYFYFDYEKMQAFKARNKYVNDNINGMELYVNGRKLTEESVRCAYPSTDNNGPVLLGSFEDEYVRISLKIMKDLEFNNLVFGELDLYKLGELCGYLGQREICSNISVVNEGFMKPVRVNFDFSMPQYAVDGKKSLFIPISYEKGMKCFVNGMATSVEKSADNFIELPLDGISEKGSNSVSLVFYPVGMSAGIKISIASLLAVAVYEVLLLLGKPRFRAVWLEKLCFAAFYAVYSIVVLGVYLIPMVFTFLSIPYRIIMHYIGG